MKAPHLVELIDAHQHAYGVSEAELIRRIGITRQKLHLWRTRGLRSLPDPMTLDGMAAELRLPYVQVLEAALRDTSYLDAVHHLTITEKNAYP